jgi:hypothetical protein
MPLSHPAIVDQRKTTPIHVLPQQVMNNMIINPVRPGSSHGIAVLQIARPDSAHGAGKTIVHGNSMTVIQAPTVLHTNSVHPAVAQVSHPTVVQTTPNQPHIISSTGGTIPPMMHTVPLVTAKVPTAINGNTKTPVIEIRPGRIGIDTKIVHTQPTSQPQFQPQQFKNPFLQADGYIKQQTATITPMVTQ